MSIKSRDLRWKKIVCEDLIVGEVKEIVIEGQYPDKQAQDFLRQAKIKIRRLISK